MINIGVKDQLLDWPGLRSCSPNWLFDDQHCTESRRSRPGYLAISFLISNRAANVADGRQADAMRRHHVYAVANRNLDPSLNTNPILLFLEHFCFWEFNQNVVGETFYVNGRVLFNNRNNGSGFGRFMFDEFCFPIFCFLW